MKVTMLLANRIDDNTILNTPFQDDPHKMHHISHSQPLHHKHDWHKKYTKIPTCNQQHSNLHTINSIFNFNWRSSSRIAIKNSLHSYKQSIIKPKYQELILVVNRLPFNDIPRVHISNMHPNTLLHQHYI